jgi:hypothetical protein
MTDQTAPLTSLKTALQAITEGRKARGRIYPQWLLLCIIVLAKLCGYHHFTTFARFIRNHQELLGLLGFERSDRPCDDTFRYALKHIKVAELEEILGDFALEITKIKYAKTEGESIKWQGVSVDGKNLKGTGSMNARDHLVSLYHHEARTVLAQGNVDHKSNEIPKAISLLEGMDLIGLVITADALLTQRKITSVIESRDGRYLLSLKENHESNFEDLQEVFRTDFPPITGTELR